MRVGRASAPVLALCLLGPGTAGAQTEEVQQKTEARIALARLRSGVLIGQSVRVLAQAPVDGALLSLRKAKRGLRRLREAEPPKKDDAPPVKASAEQLAEAFQTNEAFADENYTDKVVEVSGAVGRVRRSPLGTASDGLPDYAVVIYSGPAREPADTPIVLLFSGKHRKELAALRPGQAVVIRGTCVGLRVWSGEPKGKKDYTEVWVADCTLVKAAQGKD